MTLFRRLAGAVPSGFRDPAGGRFRLPRHLLAVEGDRVLLFAVLVLCAAGLLMVFSVTGVRTSRPTTFLESQAIKVLFGLLVFQITLRIDYHHYARWAPWLYAGGIALLVFVLFFGHEAKGAQRWLEIAGIRIQPVDFARVGLVAYLAFLLSKPRAKLERFKTGLLPCLVALGAMAALVILQPNMSSVIALTMITVLMVIAGRIPWKHLGLVAATTAVAAPFAAPKVLQSYQWHRIVDWFLFVTTGKGTLEGNYQLYQSLVAIGSGGLFGQGLGGSRQKWYFLPDAHTDFIFSIVGEEFGFVGAMVLILLLLVVLWRAYEAARRAPDRFGSLLALGIGISIAVYAGVNLCVVTGLYPTTGLPLPLVSYGGSAVIATLLSLGILNNILSQAVRPGTGHGERDR